MTHWGWLIVAVFVGAAFGGFFMAMFAARAFADAELAHFNEIRRLIMETRESK